jgi:CRISPR/Cas system-associated exonuclease Cas4 (RecB family)
MQEIKDINFSYSNLSSFHTCKYGWYLTYIEKKDRGNNWFGNFGSFCHNILEKYFRYELDSFELSKYFSDNYDKEVTIPCPSYPANMENNYKMAMLDFFDGFSFDRTKYNVIILEDFIQASFNGTNLVVKPDLVLENIETKQKILLDYKTSKWSKNKEEEYRKQMEMYAFFLWKEKEIEINKIFIWFLRNKKFVEINFSPFVEDTLLWITKTLKEIEEEKDWLPNNTNKNKFFCFNLCGMAEYCRHTK